MSTQTTYPLLHFYLLGELHITVEEDAGIKTVPLPPQRTHPLLQTLLLRPRPLARERIAGWLFPDIPEKIGRQRVSDLLWILRHELPALPIQITTKELFLPPQSRWLDVELFRQKTNAVEDLNSWQEAINLYRGPMVTHGHSGWLDEEREVLHLQYIRLLHRIGNYFLQNQQSETALPFVQRLIQEEPYDEKAVRMLMQIHRTLGQRGAALAVYEQFARTAQKELGIRPEPATQALAEAIQTAAPLTPRTVPFITRDSSPEKLLHWGRAALDRADRPTVLACLERLQNLLPNCGQQFDERCIAYKCLQIDLALLYDEYQRAQEILQSCDLSLPAFLARQARLEFFLDHSDTAHQIAEQALLKAYETGNQQDQLEALLVLARVESWLGRGTQALVSIEKALTLARQANYMATVARARLIQSFILIHQGRQDEATRAFREVLSLAHEHDLPAHRAEAWHGLSIIQSQQGKLTDAEENNHKALQIWRDLRLHNEEARTLQNLAMLYAQLGRNADGLALLHQAREIYQQMGNRFNMAYNQYCEASLLQYEDGNALQQSINVATTALQTFRQLKMPGWEAPTLNILGYSFWLTGQYANALQVLEESYHLHKELGEMLYLPEVLLIQGLAHLGLEQKKEALDCTRRALLFLAQGAADNQYAPAIYYAHAKVLEATGKTTEAYEYFNRGYQTLLKAAAQLKDEMAREAFFHREPIVHRLMQEVYDRGIAPPPNANVITQILPALDGSRLLPVRLTVDAGPPDTAIRKTQGKVALRRAQITRLIQEAASQGASFTPSHLADLLKVSKRTIQRDQSLLQEQQLYPMGN